MYENIFKDLLGEIVENELVEFDNAPEWKPSLRHRLAMKRIFARYERNVQKLKVNERTATYEPQRFHLKFMQRIILALVIVLLMTFMVGWVAVFVSKDFHGKVYADNTQLYAVNTENSPTIIEHEYYLSEIPDGYELYEYDALSFSVCTIYKNSENRSLTFEQEVKKYFDHHYDNERASFEEVDINGHLGLYLDFRTELGESGILVWDNNDYILEISGDFSKSELINLAKSIKLSDKSNI